MKLHGWLVSLTLSLVSTTIQADTFADNFNTQSYSNQSGSHNWSSDWIESGDSGNNINGGVASGDIEITGGELRLRDDDRNITRAVNLSAYSTITLAFDYDEQDFDNSTDDWVEIQIRSGGSGSFTTLQRFAGNGVNTGSYSIDISSYNNALVEIRFQTSPDLGGSDALYIDNLLITATVAVACSALFPDAISSNNAAGSLNFSWNSRVIGSPDNILETTNLIDGSGGVSCNTVACSQSGSVVSAVSYSTFPGGANVAVGVFGSQTLAPGNYGNISANVFSTLTLSAGDYTVSGNLDIGFAANLVVSGSGTARIFVNGTVSFNSQTDINNPGNAEQLVIFSNGNIAMTSPTIANGFFYSNGTVFLGSSSSVSGAITASSVNLESPSTVTYQASAVGNTDFGALCSAAPVPIAEYYFDELAWNGTAGEVADSTGNGLDGRAVNGATTSDTTPDPARTGNPGTCRYADLNGGTQYVEVADNNQLDLGTALTVTTWIYPRSFPSSDLKTILSKDTNYEFHVTPGRQINWWWNSAGGATQQFTTTGSQLNPDTWYHVAIVYTNGAQRIYINGVERGAATFAGNLITNNIPLLIGTDTGFVGSRNFDGPIDEVKIFNQALSASEIQAIYAETHPCAVTGPDHYSISYSGTALTCEPLTVTITGHDSADTPAAPASGTVIALSTSTALGVWSNASGGTLVDNGNGNADYTFAGNTSVTLSFNHSVAGAVNFDINSASSPNEGVGAEDPTVTFVDTGFRIVDGLDNPIPTQISARPSGTGANQLYLQAVRTDTNTGACVGAFASGVLADIDMAVECINPATCISGTDLAVAYTDSGGANSATLAAQDDVVSPSYTTVPGMLFGADSKTPIELTYPEAGQIQLHSRYAVLDGTGTPTGETIGGTTQFVVKPVGFCVQAQIMGGADPACATMPLDQCSAYVAAGANFDLLIAAKAWESDADTDFCDIGNATTENFASTNVALASNLVAPGGGVNGSLSVVGGMTINSGSGGGSITQLETFSEVGVFTFEAEDNSYFGETIFGSSVNVGRFIPDHFDLVPASPNPIVPGNDVGSSVTYLNQPFTVSYSLIARSALSPVTVTQNYAGVFAKLDPDLMPSLTNHGAIGSGEDIVYGIVDTTGPTSFNARFTRTVPGALAWSAGMLDVTDLEVTITRNAVPEAPYSTIKVGINVNESDGVGFQPSAVTLDTDTTPGADAAEIGDLPGILYYGRAFVPPVYGPEINAGDTTLIPFEIQYYNGSIFTRNTADNSSLYGNGETMDQPGITVFNHSGNILPADIIDSDVNFPSPGLSVLSGLGDTITINRPGTNKDGTVDITFTVDPWLQYDWNGSGDEDPTTTITFGTYRGHDRIIYWRELH